MGVLPAYLTYGNISVYGQLSDVGITGIKSPDDNSVFGVINQRWGGFNVYAQIGNSVLFRRDDIVCQLAYDNGNGLYTVLKENKIILTEKPPL